MADRRQADAWQDWGVLDPLWSNLTDEGMNHGAWDLAEFWRLGEKEIAGVMSTADRIGYPKAREEALDPPWTLVKPRKSTIGLLPDA